ncbi:membrane protein [Spirochaetia bacterium]|nr:membrane protein [Spirochaetia bacterium]
MNTTISFISLGFLLVFSAFFSASETSFSSLNRIKIKNMAAQGNKKAILVLAVIEHYDRFLSTVLIGNNIVNIGSSALCTVLFISLFGDAGAGAATVVMTILILIIGEITPKTLAKESPEQFALHSAYIVRFFMFIFRPFNFLAGLWRTLIIGIFRVKSDRSITEAELLTFVKEARQDGGINEREERMIQRTIAFDEVNAGSICTPRIDMEAIAADAPVELIEKKFRETGFSRLPVYENSIDRIIGVLLLKDFFWTKDVRDAMKPAVCISESMKIAPLLKLLQKKQSQLAVIIDEFGGTVGIVTVEDIVEELVGEIWDEHDDITEYVTRIDDRTYRINGSFSFGEMLALFGLDRENSERISIAGWIIEQAGHLTEKGERFTFKDIAITVSKIKQHRILEVYVHQEPAAQ